MERLFEEVRKEAEANYARTSGLNKEVKELRSKYRALQQTSALQAEEMRIQREGLEKALAKITEQYKANLKEFGERLDEKMKTKGRRYRACLYDRDRLIDKLYDRLVIAEEAANKLRSERD